MWSSVGMAPAETWVRLRGGENVRIQVVGDGQPVVFLHGGSSSGANWAPLLAHLNGWKSFVVDRPGCGLSDPVAGGSKIKDISTVEAFADGLLADLLDGLELDTAHVISTSFGGYFAFRGAAAQPERVDRLVEIAWPMGAPIGKAPSSMRLAAIPGLGAMTIKIPPTRFAIKVILKQLGMRRALENGRITDEFIDWFLALLRHTDTMANELRANPKIVTPIAGINERMVLSAELTGRITSPVLFIWGAEDPLGGASVALRFAEQFDDARVEMLPLAGHAPWVDEPERCATLVSDFLAAAQVV